MNFGFSFEGAAWKEYLIRNRFSQLTIAFSEIILRLLCHPE